MHAETAHLTPRQKRFVAAIVGAPTITEAASRAGIARRTAYNYLELPHVRQAIKRQVDEAMKQASRQAIGAMSAAIAALVEIADAAPFEATASARVSAARAILENAARLSADIDILERIEALEAACQAR